MHRAGHPGGGVVGGIVHVVGHRICAKHRDVHVGAHDDRAGQIAVSFVIGGGARVGEPRAHFERHDCRTYQRDDRGRGVDRAALRFIGAYVGPVALRHRHAVKVHAQADSGRGVDTGRGRLEVEVRGGWVCEQRIGNERLRVAAAGPLPCCEVHGGLVPVERAGPVREVDVVAERGCGGVAMEDELLLRSVEQVVSEYVVVGRVLRAVAARV